MKLFENSKLTVDEMDISSALQWRKLYGSSQHYTFWAIPIGIPFSAVYERVSKTEAVLKKISLSDFAIYTKARMKSIDFEYDIEKHLPKTLQSIDKYFDKTSKFLRINGILTCPASSKRKSWYGGIHKEFDEKVRDPIEIEVNKDWFPRNLQQMLENIVARPVLYLYSIEIRHKDKSVESTFAWTFLKEAFDEYANLSTPYDYMNENGSQTIDMVANIVLERAKEYRRFKTRKKLQVMLCNPQSERVPNLWGAAQFMYCNDMKETVRRFE